MDGANAFGCNGFFWGLVDKEPYTYIYIYIYIFIISSTVILAADWSIAVGYWTVSPLSN